MPRKPRKIGFEVSGAVIQTSAVDTRIAVWVSTAEKCFKIVLGATRNVSRKARVVSAPALYKDTAIKWAGGAGGDGLLRVRRHQSSQEETMEWMLQL